MHRANINIKVEGIAKVIGKDRSTIYRWLAGIKAVGIKEFLRRKKNCKQRRPGSRTPEYIAQLVVDIRNEFAWCGQKIKKELQVVHNIVIGLSTIYRILHRRFTKAAVGIKKYQKHQAIVTANGPREVVEHDTVDLGGKVKDNSHGNLQTAGLYAYTSIDIFTKEPTVILATDLTMVTGAKVFRQQKAFYGHVDTHQSDNGSEFQEAFKIAVEQTGAKHRYSRPYKKNEQAHIENFNKALRRECFPGANYNPRDIKKLQQRANEFVDFYINRRWHMGLPDMMTPAEHKQHYQSQVEGAIIRVTTG
jgi:IS30 family transposase